MNTHPYLRAYMAGIVAPSFGLLVALTVFIVTRLVLQLPIPIECVIIFPMALVPNAFGLWNIGSSRRRLWRISDVGRAWRHLVPGDQRPLLAHCALVPGRRCSLLPGMEVCRGLSQPIVGNSLKGRWRSTTLYPFTLKGAPSKLRLGGGFAAH